MYWKSPNWWCTFSLFTAKPKLLFSARTSVSWGPFPRMKTRYARVGVQLNHGDGDAWKMSIMSIAHERALKRWTIRWVWKWKSCTLKTTTTGVECRTMRREMHRELVVTLGGSRSVGSSDARARVIRKTHPDAAAVKKRAHHHRLGRHPHHRYGGIIGRTVVRHHLHRADAATSTVSNPSDPTAVP